jgi:lipopolysaccharide/colanic/teichoic acid biosynthesis glycosyltransferase
MSLVGPRPEVRKYVNYYTPEQMQVLSVRPGITDPASIKFSNENDLLTGIEDPEKHYIQVIMPQKLALNLEYIRRQNFWRDIGILFRTARAIFRKG